MAAYVTEIATVHAHALSRFCPTYLAISRDFRFRRRPTQKTTSPRLLRPIAAQSRPRDFPRFSSDDEHTIVFSGEQSRTSLMLLATVACLSISICEFETRIWPTSHRRILGPSIVSKSSYLLPFDVTLRNFVAARQSR